MTKSYAPHGFDKASTCVFIKNYLNDGSDAEGLVLALNKVVEIVVNRHYSKYLEYVPEFRSVCYMKIFKVLPLYDPEKDIFTFLYTIVRNEIHNWLYFLNKDRMAVNVEDVSALVEDGELDELSIERDMADYGLQTFMDTCFPATRYTLGGNIMEYLSLLHQLLNTSATHNYIFKDEESINRFCIFASFYLKTDAFLLLYAYYSMFHDSGDFGTLLIALTSIRSKLPNTRVIKRIIDDYTLFNKNTVAIKIDKIPETLKPLEQKLAAFDLTLQDVLACMDGERVIDTRWFGK